MTEHTGLRSFTVPPLYNYYPPIRRYDIIRFGISIGVFIIRVDLGYWSIAGAHRREG
jgi:hypothetical protein